MAHSEKIALTTTVEAKSSMPRQTVGKEGQDSNRLDDECGDVPQMAQTSQTALMGTRFLAILEKRPRSGRPRSREKAWKVRAVAWRAVETTEKAVKQTNAHKT